MIDAQVDTARRSLALAAAQQAAEAVAELLRFAYATFSEGVEVYEKLCDALKLVAEIEPKPDGDTDYVEMRGRVDHAVSALLEGWVE